MKLRFLLVFAALLPALSAHAQGRWKTTYTAVGSFNYFDTWDDSSGVKQTSSGTIPINLSHDSYKLIRSRS